MLAVSGQDDNLEALNVDGVAGMDDAARLGLDDLEVSGVVGAGDLGVLAVHAVVNEFSNRHALDQLRQSAHVVVVEMRDEHVVEARDAGVAHGCLDALGVAAIGGGPAGIDQQRCARRRHQQRGLPALYINGVDKQVFFRNRGLRLCRLRGEEQRQRANGK